MNVISISKKRFNELQPIVLSKKILCSEGDLYEFDYRGNKKMVKKFYHQNGQVFANKLYTIEMLDSNREYLPDNFCIPDNLLVVSGKAEAFTSPFVEGKNLSTIFHNRKIEPKEQIEFLKKIGELLQQMKNIRKYTPLNDIFLNDLHQSNFIVTPNGQIKVIDLDSCKIGTNDPFLARYLTPFALLNYVDNKYKINVQEGSQGYVVADENSDIYCYIITILNYLYGKSVNNMTPDQFYDYMNYLDHIKINKNLIQAFEKILTNTKNENPLPYLDTIKNEQVYKAREAIYKRKK